MLASCDFAFFCQFLDKGKQAVKVGEIYLLTIEGALERCTPEDLLLLQSINFALSRLLLVGFHQPNPDQEGKVILIFHLVKCRF